MSEEELRELLREMRADPIPVNSLARVRISVAQRVRNRRRWRGSAALSLAAVSVAVLVIIFLPIAQPPHTNTNLVVRRAEPSVTTEQQPTQPRVLRAANRPVRRHLARPQGVVSEMHKENGNPILIRIETQDPNILILLVEEK